MWYLVARFDRRNRVTVICTLYGKGAASAAAPFAEQVLIHHTHPFCHDCDKILYICHDRGGRETASVEEFIYDKFVSIYCVQVEGSYFSGGEYTEGRRHVSCCDGVKHGGKADECRRVDYYGAAEPSVQ